MATPIRPIPILTGEAAERFVRLAEEAERNPKKIDFSKQREACRKMLEKSRKLGYL